MPGVKSVATLPGYDTTEAFTGTEKTKVSCYNSVSLALSDMQPFLAIIYVVCLQFINTLQANILANLGVVSNVTINSVTKGSVLIDNTVAFTGADQSAAANAQAQLASLLATPSGISSVYGSGYGTVTVASISQENTASK